MFLRAFDNPLPKYCTLEEDTKNFLHTVAVLGYVPKLKRGMGLAFDAHLYYFSINHSLFKTLSIDKVSTSRQNFFPSYIKQDMLLSSYLDN